MPVSVSSSRLANSVFLASPRCTCSKPKTCPQNRIALTMLLPRPSVRIARSSLVKSSSSCCTASYSFGSHPYLHANDSCPEKTRAWPPEGSHPPLTLAVSAAVNPNAPATSPPRQPPSPPHRAPHPALFLPKPIRTALRTRSSSRPIAVSTADGPDGARRTRGAGGDCQRRQLRQQRFRLDAFEAQVKVLRHTLFPAPVDCVRHTRLVQLLQKQACKHRSMSLVPFALPDR